MNKLHYAKRNHTDTVKVTITNYSVRETDQPIMGLGNCMIRSGILILGVKVVDRCIDVKPADG
jgi:hypothetical protein